MGDGQRIGRFTAFCVHILTASGALWALLATLSAARGDWAMMFAWLGVALFVDGVDGPLARKFDVIEHLPGWDGGALDYVIDYATYVFLPAFALAWSLLMPFWMALLAACIIALAGALYFARTDIKAEDNCFIGFPAVWNGIVFILFVYQPNPWLSLIICVLFAALSFLPIKFVHPVRVVQFRSLTLGVTLLWALMAGATLAFDLTPPVGILLVLALTSFYLATIGGVIQFLSWSSRRSESGF